MSPLRITLACLLATVVFTAAACGGGSDSVPSGSIAVVDGTEIAKEDLDQLIAQAKKGYESQGQDFPKAGTPEFQSIQTQYVAYLVELEELRQAADELGISVTGEGRRHRGAEAHRRALRRQARRLREGAREAGLLGGAVSQERARGLGALLEDLRRGHEGRR